MDSSASEPRKPRSSNNDKSVDDEVQKLFRKNNGKISQSTFNKLRQQYNDVELVDKIQKVYLEKHKMINKKASKFAQLIRDKYSNRQYPFHILLEKARLFKVKYDLSEEEFAEFQRIYENELYGNKSSEILNPVTNMTKILGSINPNFDTDSFNMKMNDSDYKSVQEILKLYASSKHLFSQLALQTMQYEDCDFQALTGEFDRKFNSPSDSVHPVIAAMFIPKIKYLEDCFLNSNIASIVNCRYNKKPLNNRADYELFYALTNDPNDIVCDSRSPVADLLSRAHLQNHLWNCVLNLRNGKYYNPLFRDFVGAIDVCRLNKNDMADSIYGHGDSVILKRLLSSFSFRPTMVSTISQSQIINLNPYQQNVRPVITPIPMINLKLPLELSINSKDSIRLESAIDEEQLFFENGIVVPRRTSIIYSRGVIFFYVDRRSHVIKHMGRMSYNITLPVVSSGFEKLNSTLVHFNNEFQISGETFRLRSVVIAHVNNSDENLIIGSKAIIIRPADMEHTTNTYLVYDPVGVIRGGLTDPDPKGNMRPVTHIPETTIIGNNEDSFYELCSRYGTIFMYQNLNEKDKD